MTRHLDFRPRPVSVAFFVAYAVGAKLLPYLLAKFGMSLAPSTTPYPWGLVLFEQVYKPLVDEWYHWVSDDEGPRHVDHSAG